MERNLLLKIQYDGSAYHGWQVQENARSVQGVFQEALKQVLHTQPDIKACSRTDTGVHAREFCLSMKLSHNIRRSAFGRTQSFSAAGHRCAFLRRSAA